tara:strand:- start:319 stop:810 length:492 start_codon:yes stop_codon:yes gene_type:complete
MATAFNGVDSDTVSVLDEKAKFERRFGSFDGMRPIMVEDLAIVTDGSFGNWPVRTWPSGELAEVLATQPAGLRAAFGDPLLWKDAEARTMSFGQARNCTYAAYSGLKAEVPFLLRELNAQFPYHADEFALLEQACADPRLLSRPASSADPPPQQTCLHLVLNE